MPQIRPSEYAVEFDITYPNDSTHDHRCVYLAGEAECLKFIDRLNWGQYSVVNICIWRSDSQWKNITLEITAQKRSTQ